MTTSCISYPRRRRQLVPLAALLSVLLSGSASAADDTVPPQLRAVAITPSVIDTSAGPAEVTLEFTVSDEGSGVSYFEASLVDPSGTFRQSASGWIAPLAAGSFETSVMFPRFSAPGEWTLSNLLLSDTSGNTLALGADEIAERGFSLRLEVRSARDTVRPRLASLEFAPSRIDTSRDSADVTVSIGATDDLSGVNYIELSFVSPTGTNRVGRPVRIEAARSITSSITLTFPRRSEAGPWTLASIFLSDAANNTLALDGEGIAGYGFHTSLEVVSAEDSEPPSLKSLQFSPHAIDTSSGPASVKVQFQAADNLSGVRSLELVFESPSGVSKQRVSAAFPSLPEVDGVVEATFPPLSEPGGWTLSGALLADDAGNTLALDAEAIKGMGVRTGLSVTSAQDTSPPQLSAIGFAPEQIDTRRGPAEVRVGFVASDNSSGVKSLEINFVNPSESARVRGSVELRPAAQASGTIRLVFPQQSEPGVWRMETAVLTDAANNTLTLDSAALASRVRVLQVR